MVVMHNLVAMNSNRMVGINKKNQAKNSEKLSSGYRINRSADDASGLAISEKMRRQIRGLSQASLNAQDGISMVQIADGAMEEVHSMVHRGTELCIKAANGTLSEEDRSYIQEEIEQLKTEINGISDRTDFNGIKVLKGGDIPFVETNSEVIIKGGLPSFITMDQNSSDTMHLGEIYITKEKYVDDNGVETEVDIKHAASYLDFSQFTGTQEQIKELIGEGFYTTCCTCTNHYSIEFTNDTTNSVENSGNHYIYKIGVSGVSTAEELLNRIVDGTDNGNPKNHFTKLKADTANKQLIIYDDRSSETDSVSGSHTWIDWDNPSFNTKPRGDYGKIGPGAAYSKNDINKLIPPTELELQIGAEAGQHLRIDLPSISSLTLGISDVNAKTIEGASEGITLFKKAVEYVSSERSRMGAYQNRLEHTINNLDNVVENTQASESKIRDTDMAKLMVEYANGNILAQAGQAMLAQANQNNQGILNLLG